MGFSIDINNVLSKMKNFFLLVSWYTPNFQLLFIISQLFFEYSRFDTNLLLLLFLLLETTQEGRLLNQYFPYYLQMYKVGKLDQ